MKTVGLKDCTFKVGHVGVLRGVMEEEKLAEEKQNAAMQLMDKKNYDEAFRLVKDAGASEKCIKILQKLVEIKGANVFETVKKMRNCIRNYGKASAATENLYEILKLVSESTREINITVEAGFARGLEYYTGMIFEVTVPQLDIALGGGGRYDKLIEVFGGEPTPAVGVAHGIDRIMLAMQTQKIPLKIEEENRVVVIPTDEKLIGRALEISQMLRDADIPTEVEVMGRKVTKALEDADRRKIKYAVIVGEKELKEDAVVLRDLAGRTQKTVSIKQLAEVLA
jgi:histidyl-tRNA synthetase